MRAILLLCFLSAAAATTDEEELLSNYLKARYSQPVPAEALLHSGLSGDKSERTSVVNTTTGEVQGFVSTTNRGGTRYNAFLGIKFAEAPVGDLRFKSPVPRERQDGVLDAVEEGPGCMTADSLHGPMSEDCLYLNVFVPEGEVARKEPYAVMVWFYGGAFKGGSSSTFMYGPGPLLDKDVCIVTFNYRLGTLGFLHHPPSVPGNAGLEDQQLALRWVKNNIAAFGGDPERITIFGESAGAASVGHQLLAPSSAGLFQRAIQQSGSSLCQWGWNTAERGLEKAKSLAEKLGCKKDEVVKCLRGIPAEMLVQQQDSVTTLKDMLSLNIYSFLPVAPGPLIADHPQKLMREGKFLRDVETLLGSNSAEALLILPALNKQDPNGIYQSLVNFGLGIFAPSGLDIEKHPILGAIVKNRMRGFYFNWKPISGATTTELLNMITDKMFTLPMQANVKYLKQYSSQPVYNYYFTVDDVYNIFKLSQGINESGAAHADELGYLFEVGSLDYSADNVVAEKTIDRMTCMWAQFAKTGEPTPCATTGTVNWQPVEDNGQSSYLEIGPELRTGKCLKCYHVQFWNDQFELIKGAGYTPYVE